MKWDTNKDLKKKEKKVIVKYYQIIKFLAGGYNSCKLNFARTYLVQKIKVLLKKIIIYLGTPDTVRGHKKEKKRD